jgi:restriction endonuclease S subunit
MHTKEEYKYLKFTDLTKTVFWDYYTLSNKNAICARFELVKLEQVLYHRKEFITISDNIEYKRCRVQIQGKGVVLRDEIYGKEIKTKNQQVCKADDFLVAEIDAKVGGYGIVPNELEGAVVSGHYFLFEIVKSKLLPEFLGILVKYEQFSKQVKSTGSTNYSAIRPYHVLDYLIPLPSLSEQEAIVNNYYSKIKEAEALEKQANDLEGEIERYLYSELDIIEKQEKVFSKKIRLVNLVNIERWGVEFILGSNSTQLLESNKF